ncbi:MAG TPA: purine-nucleoside phosphorylase [bacterium]|nr:purine-nucleoside phosphorylase [bacterium]
MSSLYERINKAVEAIREKTDFKAEIGIILGTGLGKIAGELEIDTVIPYEEIPGFAKPTIFSHEGKLLFGKFGGKNVIAMQGRFHVYEGYTPEQVTFPVRVLKALGINDLIVSNAAGGLNRFFKPGELMIIDDHINMMGINPLIGPNDDRLGIRFPDMSEPYSRELICKADEIAVRNGIKAHRGVYLAVTGPNLETAAEYRMFGMIGADAVGMSTIPEVIVAKHSSLRVFGISVITDMCIPDCLKPASINEIISAANKAEPALTLIIKELINGL